MESFIIKGLEPRGLKKEVTICVNRGADSEKVVKRLQNMDLQEYKDVII